MGAAKKAVKPALFLANPATYLANTPLMGMAGMNPIPSIPGAGSPSMSNAGNSIKLPSMPDSTDAMLKELARMGMQRKLLQSSGRLGAFKGFDTNLRPTGR